IIEYFWTASNWAVVEFERMVAKIAIPKAPAKFLDKARIEEATPTSCKGTVPVAACVKAANPTPIPMAKANSLQAISKKVHLTSIPEKFHNIKEAQNIPMETNSLMGTRYSILAPVWAPIIIPNAIGINRYPDLV